MFADLMKRISIWVNYDVSLYYYLDQANLDFAEAAEAAAVGDFDDGGVPVVDG